MSHDAALLQTGRSVPSGFCSYSDKQTDFLQVDTACMKPGSGGGMACALEMLGSVPVHSQLCYFLVERVHHHPLMDEKDP